MATHVPARAPATIYSVQLLGFLDGQLITRGETTFELSEGGFTALVSSLAQEHGLAYGLFAVMAAVASGLLVGFVFGSRKH